MSCAYRARLIEQGPEGLGDHLAHCAACQADVERLDEAMADLWDELEDFVDADVPPLVVAPPPPEVVEPPPANRSAWPQLGLVLAVAAVLWLVVWPMVRPVLAPEPAAMEDAEPELREEPPASEETPEDPASVQAAPPVQTAPDDPLREGGPGPRTSPDAAPWPAEPVGAVDSGGACGDLRWWTWRAPVSDRCVAALATERGGQVVQAALEVAGGEPLTVPTSALEGEVVRLSRSGRHAQAAELGRWLVDRAPSASTARVATLATRQWMDEGVGSAREARRLAALAMADRWLSLSGDGDAAAIAVRESLVRSAEERALCPPLLYAEADMVDPAIRCPFDQLSTAQRADAIAEAFGRGSQAGVEQVRTIRQHGRLTAQLAYATMGRVPPASLHLVIREVSQVPSARSDEAWVRAWREGTVRMQQYLWSLDAPPRPVETMRAFEAARAWASLAPDDEDARQAVEQLRGR